MKRGYSLIFSLVVLWLSATSVWAESHVVTVDTAFPETLQPNTTYEIVGDVVLTSNMTIPDGVTLFFKGGSISAPTNKNVTIDCMDNTDPKKPVRKAQPLRPMLAGDVKFNKTSYRLTWKGGFANDDIYMEWFNPSIDNNFDNAPIISEVANQLHNQSLIFSRMLPIRTSVVINKGTVANLRGTTLLQGGYAVNVTQPNAGVYIVGGLFHAITVRGTLNLYSFSCIGAPSAFVGRNPRFDGVFYDDTLKDPYGRTHTINSDKALDFYGLNCESGSGVENITDCCFMGFARGISFYAMYPGFVTRCFISSCKWGLWVKYASDFFCTNCKFNSCLGDFDFTKNIKVEGQTMNPRTDVTANRYIGGGVYLCSTAMIQFNACRWEFNYLGIFIDSGAYNVSVNGSIFDRETHSVVCFSNTNEKNSLGEVWPERQQPAICGFNFTGNNVLRGALVRYNIGNPPIKTVPGVAYFAFKSVPDATTDEHIKDPNGLRRCNITICNNTFEDPMELGEDGYAATNEYEKAIFFFDCKDEGGVHITHTGNDYSVSRATYFCESYGKTAGQKGYAIIEGSGNSYPTGMDFKTPFFYTSDVAKNAQVAHLNEMCVENGIIYYYDTVNGGGKVPLYPSSNSNL